MTRHHDHCLEPFFEEIDKTPPGPMGETYFGMMGLHLRGILERADKERIANPHRWTGEDADYWRRQAADFFSGNAFREFYRRLAAEGGGDRGEPPCSP